MGAVVRFLSDEWIEELDRVARGQDGSPTGAGDATLVVQHEVADGPDGPVTWHVELTGDTVRVRPGPAPQPMVTFHERRAVAAGIARGDLSAQRAFMAGDLRVEGSLDVLVEHAGALASIADVFGEVRRRTDFDDA